MIRTTIRILVSLGFVAGIAGLAGATEGTYRPDSWITLKTKLALLTGSDVSGTEINVDTVNGRVTLHGKVGSVEEKNRATEVARRIDGTAEVRNLLQVVSATRKPAMNERDEEIKKRAEAALEKNTDLRSSHIEVQSVNNGVVLIAGKATSLSDHLAAVQTVRGVAGVRRVETEVETPPQLTERELGARATDTAAAKSPAGGVKQTLSDSWITTSAKLRLLANDTTPALEINVDTDHGVVTLFGIVPTEEAKKTAELEVAGVSGVKSVVNALQVVPESAQKAVAASDEEVKEAVAAALEGRAGMKHVDVEIKNGVAHLTGKVPDSTERLQASLVVRSARGVRAVQNDLQVEVQ